MKKPIISWDFGLRLLDNDYLVTSLMKFKEELVNFNWDYMLVPNSDGSMQKVKDPDEIDNHYDWLNAVIPELEKMCKERGIDFKEEVHRREMINSYAFFMEKYFDENKAFHFPTNIVEHDDVRYVLEHEGRLITIEFDPSWSQLVYTVNGKGPFAHTSYEDMWDDIRDVLAYEDQERIKLAERLNEFYKDFDFYDYMDSLDSIQSEEDVVEGLVEQLLDPNTANGILEFLKDIKENGEPDEEQAKALDELIEGVTKIHVSFVVSFDDKLNEAKEKSSLTENIDRDIGKNIELG